MIVYVLNPSLETIGVIDDYYSLIWTERHYEAGQFELELPIYYQNNPIIESGNFLTIESSPVLMILQGIKTSRQSDRESILITGESAESLLKRRSTLEVMNVDVEAEALMYSLVDDHVVNPSDPFRTITILGGTVGSLTFTEIYQDQFERESIYDICVKIAKATGLGFSVVRSRYDETQLAFAVYKGTDRSAGQSELPWIIFSKNFDNVLSGSYYINDVNQVNLVKVITDDTVYPSIDVWMPNTSLPEDLDRYERVLETSIDREIDEGNPLTNNEVLAIINTRGRSVILENRPKGIFDGDFDIEGNLKYGIDFFMGDMVQIYFEDYATPARVVELVRSYTAEGIKTYMALDYIDI